MYCKPQFYGVRAMAANLGHSKGNYAVADFQADYPQFFNKDGEFLGSLPMLEQIIEMANTAVQPDKWLALWRGALCSPLRSSVFAGLRRPQRDGGASGCIRGNRRRGQIRRAGRRLCRL